MTASAGTGMQVLAGGRWIDVSYSDACDFARMMAWEQIPASSSTEKAAAEFRRRIRGPKAAKCREIGMEAFRRKHQIWIRSRRESKK